VTGRTLLDEAPPTPRDVLEGGLSDYFGSAVRIVDITGESVWGGTEYPLKRLRVTLASGDIVPVIFKRRLPAPDPDPVGNVYMREVLIYRRLLARERFGAPAVYASVYEEPRDRYWLFLEDVGDVTLEDGTAEDFVAAARWLAGLHAAHTGRDEALRSLGCLGEHGSRFYQALAAKARRNLHVAGAGQALIRFDKLMERYASIVNDLLARPRTLVHGDLAPHNLVLQRGRVRPVDWEWAAVGPAAWDLARLLYGWGSSLESMCLDAYVTAFGRDGAVAIERDDLEETLRQCRFVYNVWYLSQQPHISHDAVHVDKLLDAMETTRSR
jgi:hypothetical protein